ncbi:hypothetical protein PAXRUDRAFT_830373 [Paxillus rubicundulus Ve08.2h10]|uniref:Uncharacterized protein n=1 Tax=Paxillus rubicundulus Ve08.2h10 TaxID=930991 RepID=A0A0D0D5N5_9AGAM|nr:hypothetical protein PAXRUDRAFT_830373 [Paxillus rubicundulus Ve08.2h10]
MMKGSLCGFKLVMTSAREYGYFREYGSPHDCGEEDLVGLDCQLASIWTKCWAQDGPDDQVPDKQYF